MISGRGYFEIQLPDGSAAYTRNSPVHPERQGTIVTPGNGYPLQPEIRSPRTPRASPWGEDGQVSVQLKGDGQSQVVGQISTTDFVNPTGLQPMGRTSSSRPSPAAPHSGDCRRGQAGG